MKLADRMQSLGGESAFEVLARARALEAKGRDVVHLEIGQPDFPTPANIRRAGTAAIEDGQTRYCDAQGLAVFRRQLAEHLGRTRGIDASPERIVVAPGAKPIIFYTIMSLVGPGDEVLYPDPGFPSYRAVVHLAGGKPVPIPLLADRDFAVDVEDLEGRVSDRTRLMILNFPENPTGAGLESPELDRIAELAVEHDLVVLTDEIYCEMSYEGEFRSIAALPGMAERTVVMDGFSKVHSMAGWRLGYGLFPEAMAEGITKLMIHSNSCTAPFTQLAGLEALTGPQEEQRKMVETFRRRRDLFVAGLNEIPGFRCPMPAGAFYAFPDVRGTGMASADLASHLLEEGGVACLSGDSFGEYGGGCIRFAYANSTANLEEGLRRIRATVERL